ncbi:MAG: ABC transporter permease [Gemmataceae bacterium]|nr:ABC transporter permease [Gemmataceae bacterium]
MKIVLVLFLVLFVGPFVLLLPFFGMLGAMELCARVGGRLSESLTATLPPKFGAAVIAIPKFAIIILKSIRRNLLRSSLSYLAVFVMVLVITGIWSILTFLDAATSAKAANFKALVTDKFQIPSQMPPSYIGELTREAANLPAGMRADPAKDVMTWSFVGTSLDPDPSKRSQENMIIFFSMDPRGLLNMMDDLEQDRLSPADAKQMRENVAAMQTNIKGIVLSEEKLRTINRKVGDRLKVYCFPGQYKDIEFDVEIVGTFPRSAGRYDGSAILNLEYLQKSLDAYERKTGKQHPMSNRYINLFWVRVPNEDAMRALAESLDKPGRFSTPPVKIERGSSAVSSFLDAYKDIIAGMRYLLVPAIVAVMILVIANAISISVRERRPEMAVLKVLGFQPWQVLILILGEALIVGVLAGGLCTTLAYYGVNARGGIQFPIAFFGKFFIPVESLWWGPVLGAIAAIAGSVVPAWSARSVRVSEVFAKIA